jgi:plastocyanin
MASPDTIDDAWARGLHGLVEPVSDATALRDRVEARVARRRATRRHRIELSTVVFVVALGIAAFGLFHSSHGNDAASKRLSVIDITAEQTLRFMPDHFTVPAGRVEFRLHDAPPGGTHTLQIDGKPNMAFQVTNPGEVESRTVKLRPGTYTLYCQIPGHRAAGMQATLVVTRN